MTDDDQPPKPAISLAAVRDEQPRNFAEERRNLTQEAREIGLSENMAASCVNETLLLDWLTSLSGNILEKFAEHPDPATIVQSDAFIAGGRYAQDGGEGKE